MMFRLESVDQSPLLSQGPELLADLVERNHYALFLGGRVITVTDVDRTALLFGSANNYSRLSAQVQEKQGFRCYLPKMKLYC